MSLYLMVYMVVGIIALSYFFLILYQSVGLFRAIDNEESSGKEIGVTLLVPFKNESHRITTLINDINSLTDNEINFETIFINDHSEDDTLKIISKFIKTDHRIILNEGFGKKDAIQKGVKLATKDVIVTLDADVSIGEKWLERVRIFFQVKSNDFLIMPVLIKRASGISGYFEVLDVLALSGTTISWARSRNPILCNGANMGFRKKVFQDLRINAHDLKLVSGDDVFFMHQVKSQDKNSVGIMDDMLVIAHTDAFNDFKSLINQRARWASKSRFYKDKTTNVVSWIVLINYLSIIVLGLMSFIWPWLINLFLIVLVSKIFIDFFFLVLVAIKFDKVNSLWFYPIAVLIQFVFIPVVFIKSQWGSFEWKGRKYTK